MCHFFALSSPACGRMVHVSDGVSAARSLPALYLCFCEEPDLKIAKRCHSPARVFFFFPAIRAYLGFLRRWGRKDLTSSYVTRRPKEGLPLAETHRHLPATLGSRCVSVIFHNRSVVELSDLLLTASRLVASSFSGRH